MTEQERREIFKALEDQTRAHQANPLEARAFLLRSGVYTTDGQLSAEFGGPEVKASPAARTP